MGHRQLILKACRKHPRVEELRGSPPMLQAVEDMLRERYGVFTGMDERAFNPKAIQCFTAILAIKDMSPEELAARYGILRQEALLLKEYVNGNH